ncbi:hypothetical protein DFH09DRAFT_1314665 [Mycena vulgaris]|nr:hypothetical protein DFH09DRAFT_1314665 [Mycena vulgaris]
MHASTIRALGAGALLAMLIAPFTLAVPVAQKVPVPGGYRAHANFKQVPVGGRLAHVGSNIHLFDANDTLVHVAAPVRTASKTSAALVPEETGWVTFASWTERREVPSTDNGQTIFLFNSIEPASFDGIMQPVLQYGPSAAGGGSFWAAATWYLVGDQTFFSQLVPVDVGQPLNGIISLVSSDNSTFNYVSQFTNIPGTAIQIDGGEQLTWATETLEAYAVSSASDYPAGATVFSGINLQLASGETPGMSWAVANDDADGISTHVDVDGAVNGQMTITY